MTFVLSNPALVTALSAGGYHGFYLRRSLLENILAAKRTRPDLAALLQQLGEQRLIDAQEERLLKSLIDVVQAADAPGERSPEVVARRVLAIHDRIVIRSTTSPVAVAIASVAADSAQAAVTGTLRKMREDPGDPRDPGGSGSGGGGTGADRPAASVVADDVEGAIVGGLIGGIVGISAGPGFVVGAVVGVVVGAALFSLLGAEDINVGG